MLAFFFWFVLARVSRDRKPVRRGGLTGVFFGLPCTATAARQGEAKWCDNFAPNAKVLDFGGLFVFLGVKNNPFSPLHLFPELMDLNLILY